MTYKERLQNNKFSVVVALPSNDLDLVQAALEGGADALKINCNVYNRASGKTFGDYATIRPFLQEVIAMAGEAPVGISPGGAEAFISEIEKDDAVAMGLSFFTARASVLPRYMMQEPHLTKTIMLGNDYTNEVADGIAHSLVDVVECSIQPACNYGTPMVYEDVLRYGALVQRTQKPCLVTTQRAIVPADIALLHQVGCKAIMLGAVVLGKTPTPEQLKETVRSYRNACDAL